MDSKAIIRCYHFPRLFSLFLSFFLSFSFTTLYAPSCCGKDWQEKLRVDVSECHCHYKNLSLIDSAECYKVLIKEEASFVTIPHHYHDHCIPPGFFATVIPSRHETLELIAFFETFDNKRCLLNKMTFSKGSSSSHHHSSIILNVLFSLL